MKFLRYFSLVCALSLLTGCGAPKKQTFEERFDKKYLDMQSYAASGSITVYSNKTENEYKFFMCSEKDGPHLIDYPDDKLKIVFKNGEALIANGKTNGKETVREEKDEYLHLFPDKFLKQYISEKGAEYVYEKSGANIGIKCDVSTKSGDNLVEIMLLDEKKLNPKLFTVYRKGGEKLFEMKFDEFEFVKKFKDGVFNTEGDTNEGLERDKS